MTITNKYLVGFLVKLLRLKPYKVDFSYIKEVYDKDLSKLGFLNQVKHEFNEQAETFNEELDEEIQKAQNNPADW